MAINVGESSKIYFVTNRRLDENSQGFGSRHHAQGADFYRVGTVEAQKVSEDLDTGYEVGSPEIKGEGNTDKDDRGSDKLIAEIREDIEASGCDVIAYIHGFANTFERSISRAAQICEYYQVGPPNESKCPAVVAFCWPSNGHVIPLWDYFSDRNDARAAGPFMARFLLRFFDFMEKNEPCKQRIHLVAHSMGNWALRSAVQSILDSENRPLQPIFENVFLMAADEDEDALERNRKLKPLCQMARRIHVYHSRDDLALVISDKTKFNPDRLGYGGPDDYSALDSKVISVDCEKVDDTEFLHVNHQYYRRRPEVIDDVKQVLAGVRPDRIKGREVIRPGQQYRIFANEDANSALLKTPENPEGPEYKGYK